MPHFGPTKRRDLVRRLKKLGFSGPYAGGKHQFMQRGDVTLLLPNPHEADISVELLS